MRNFPSIKSNMDYRKVYMKGRSYADKYMVMYVMPNHTSANRIGISVSKKVGNSIIRHRMARLVRECFRLHESEVKKGYDIVTVVRLPAADKSYHVLSDAYMHLCKLHGIVTD